MNNENNLSKIADILRMPVEDLEEHSKKIDEIDATYYWNPIRGGLALIVSSNGEYLGATSSVDFERHLSEFKKGEETER